MKKESKIIGDSFKASRVLDGICGNEALTKITEDNSWSKEIRDEAIKFFKEKLEAVTIKQAPNCVKNVGLQTEIFNVLKNIFTEITDCDFKLGIIDLNHGSLNKNTIQKNGKNFNSYG